MEYDIKSIKNKRILFSPLNWGLRHVTRSIFIIKTLIQQKNEVLIACDEHQKNYYLAQLTKLEYIHLRGFPFSFKGKGNWGIDLMKSYSQLRKQMLYEKQFVIETCKQRSIDIVIADQRLGFCHKEIPSILISHQLKLALPWYYFFAQQFNQKQINRFHHIWIPDEEKSKLSGLLSSGFSQKKSYIGLCSQLIGQNNDDKYEKEFKCLGIVSGPSPYAEQLYKLMIEKLNKSNKSCAIIVPETIFNAFEKPKSIEVFVQPDLKTLNALINSSNTVISRNGYTTLMDLCVKNKSAILIPTPNQHEQLYLAKLHKNNKKWIFLDEKKFLSYTL